MEVRVYLDSNLRAPSSQPQPSTDDSSWSIFSLKEDSEDLASMKEGVNIFLVHGL